MNKKRNTSTIKELDLTGELIQIVESNIQMTQPLINLYLRFCAVSASSNIARNV